MRSSRVTSSACASATSASSTCARGGIKTGTFRSRLPTSRWSRPIADQLKAAGFRARARDADPPLSREQSRARRAWRRSPCRRSSCCCSRRSAGIGADWPSPRTGSRSCSTSPASLSHHDVFARSVIALAGALLFATAALLVPHPRLERGPGGAHRRTDPAQLRVDAARHRRRAARRARGRRHHELPARDGGDRAFSRRAARARRCRRSSRSRSISSTSASARASSGARDVFLSPVLTYQLLAGIVIVAAGALMLVRSGNESDVSPSAFELALRHSLTAVLSVRPRFKEFLIGVSGDDAAAGAPAASPTRDRLAARARRSASASAT